MKQKTSKYKSQIDWGVFTVVFGLGVLGTLIAKECDFSFHRAKESLTKGHKALVAGIKQHMAFKNVGETTMPPTNVIARTKDYTNPTKTFEGENEIAIIGSGPAAIAEAMRLSLDASKVTILSDKKSLQADPDLLKMLNNYHNILVLNNVEVVDAMEIEGGRAIYLQYKNKDTEMMFLLPAEEAYNANWVPPEKQAEITTEWVQKYILSGLSSKGHPTSTSVTNNVKNQRLPDIKIHAVRRDKSK